MKPQSAKIDGELHRQAKLIAAKEGRRLSEVLNDLLKSALKKKEVAK